MARERKAQPDRLPIKVIMPKQAKERRVQGGGSKAKPLRPVNSRYRRTLSKQVGAIRKAIEPQVKTVGAAPMRMQLFSKALAKTHRPKQLFSESTCPIFAGGATGELFLKATPDGLSRLQQVIEDETGDQIVKDLSCIESFEPVTPQFRRRGVSAHDLLRRSPKGEDGFTVRVTLFDFAQWGDQERLLDDFQRQCRELQMVVSEDHGYASDGYTYPVECKTVAELEKLSEIVGVRSVQPMPIVRTIRPRMLAAKPLPNLPIPNDVEGDFPVVAVVDSGISTEVNQLGRWIVGRESYVAEKYQNSEHGTFVAGLIVWGDRLNPKLSGLDSRPCGVFDVAVIPNGDPAKGDTEALTESAFLFALEEALEQHSNSYKVWNLSLGTDEVCSLDEFSFLAQELDELQERFQVSFVIAAGNFNDVPLLDFPRSGDQVDRGRITAGADSVLAVTVGSVSHVGYKSEGPEEHCPSPFSRHGAGPNHVIKPDVVHYGGTCTTDFSSQAGVRSINGSGSAENLGTSFATPLVSRTLAQIYHQVTPTPSPVLARALLTHHARDPRTSKRVPDGEENYFGFGLPSTVPRCLECSPHSSTLVFDDVLRPGYFLEWDDFPYPPSLCRDGRYFGEIWMTVAFAPARGGSWGAEYCETHVEASFGVYHRAKSRKTGKLQAPKFRGLVPPEHKNKGVLYESFQIEQLRKWAPVRTYHGDLGENGEAGERWRLKLQLLSRHAAAKQERPQPFSLIVTIADPEQKAMVYDEMARLVRTRFQSQNLTVRASARVRTRR